MKGSDVATRLRLLVQDAAKDGWTDDELGLWITDGCNLIALLRPDACSTLQTLSLTANQTRQSVAGASPAGVRVLDVICDASTGAPYLLTDRSKLDRGDPNWHKATAGDPYCWTFDDRDPAAFYVYPPPTSGKTASTLYCRAPAAVTGATLGSVDLTPSDLFMDPLVDYVMGRLYEKESDYAANLALAAGYRSRCIETLTGRSPKAAVLASPSMTSSEARPSKAAAAGGP